MISILLPYGSEIHVCAVCGASSSFKEEIFQHTAGTESLEKTELTTGMTVMVYGEDLFFGREHKHKQEAWLVERIYYLQKEALTTAHSFELLPRHTLMIGVKMPNGSTSLPHQHLLLWQEGNKDKLREARLLPEVGHDLPF